MNQRVAAGIAQWRTAWVCLALALGLHVADEALAGFLPAYNKVVTEMQAERSWVLLPTFTFPIWLGGLILGVLVLLALTPLVFRGTRSIRAVSLVLATLMIGNAGVHFAVSLYWGRVAPGVYSSPILFVAAIALMITASRAKMQKI